MASNFSMSIYSVFESLPRFCRLSDKARINGLSIGIYSGFDTATSNMLALSWYGLDGFAALETPYDSIQLEAVGLCFGCHIQTRLRAPAL